MSDTSETLYLNFPLTETDCNGLFLFILTLSLISTSKSFPHTILNHAGEVLQLCLKLSGRCLKVVPKFVM